MSKNGKGSKTRPKSVDYATWSSNYEKIFRKNDDKKIKKIEKSVAMNKT